MKTSEFLATTPVVRSVAFFMSLVVTAAVTLGHANADDWPQWRGGNFKSVSAEGGVLGDFDKEKNMLWRVEMPGPAGSSPVVWGDNVFVTSVEGRNLFLLCVGTDGTQRWKKRLDGEDIKSRDGANGASPSPSTDGEHVWCMMGNGILTCFTVEGELAWKKDLQEEYGKFDIQFGMSTTPILDNGNLYLALMHGAMRGRDGKKPSVGHVIALDAKTGNEIWKQVRKTDGYAENKHSYASPTIYRDAGEEFLVTHGADYVIAHSLDDGSELWRCGGFNQQGDSYNPFLRLVSSPSCGPGVVIVPTAKGGPIFSLSVQDGKLKGDITKNEKAYRWKNSRGTPDVATPVVYEGFIYLAGEKGDLSCLDLETGEVVYRKRTFVDKQRSTPVAVDGKIFVTGRNGDVFVIRAGKELEVISKMELGEETTASPAISNGKLYVRTFNALYAFGEK
ncbi:MAG: PQQ-binding-like beta-propeller repeat protein [Mariniblastus sp.]